MNRLLKTLESPSITNTVEVDTPQSPNQNPNQNQNQNQASSTPQQAIQTEESVEDTWSNIVTLETFNDWINVSTYKIECLDLAIKTYRWRLQNFILFGLVLSTLSGTISVTQFGNYPDALKLFLNWALTITSFTVALLTGAVKTFKLQETLEEYIHLKQNWVSFSAKISNEIYLPKRLRRSAEVLIRENKGIFLDLLKIDVPIPKHMSILAAKHIDKGDDIESQYYKYRENIVKNEKAMNEGCMKCLTCWYGCCFCFYNKETSKKIEDNKALAKTIKYSQIENATTYKRKAYQYTLASIMLNNVKNEYNEVKLENNKTKTTETQIETNDYLNADNKYTVITVTPIEPPKPDLGQPFDFSKLRNTIAGKIQDGIESLSRSKSSDSGDSEYSEPNEVIATQETTETKQSEPATTSLPVVNQVAPLVPASSQTTATVNEEKSDDVVAKQEAILSKYQARKRGYWPKFKEHK
jgi:hypothetical protein